MARRSLGVTAAMAALALSGLAHAAGPSPALRSLVDRYVAWRGGAAFKALASVHEAGVLTEGGLAGTFQSWTSDGRWRSEIAIADMNVVDVTTAQAAWTTSLSGQPITAPEAYESARRLRAILYGDALMGGDGATAALNGRRVEDGQTWAVVSVQFGDADTYEALIDPATGQLDGLDIREKGQAREERFADWRMVDSVRMPFAQTDRSDGQGVVEDRVQTLELNQPLAPGLFNGPPGVSRAMFADGAASTGWIPFELYAGRQIYVPVTVNGRQTAALLDNGATISILDSDFATSLGLAPRGAFPTPGSGGVGVTGRVGGVTVEIGNLTLKDLTVGSANMDGFGRAMGRPVPLILGDEAFNELIVDIDFEHRRIAFIDPKSFSPPPEAVKVAMQQVRGARLAPLTIEGGPPAMFALDIGDAGTLDIAPAYAHDRNLLAGRLTAERRAVGIGGSFAVTVTTLRSVEFAGVTLEGLPASFPQTWPAATHSDQVSGRLGVGVLNRFRVTVDWPHDLLYLTPNPGAAAPFAKDRLGLALAPMGRDVIITVVEPNSPAAAAGLKVGDKIVSINGRPATEAVAVGDGPAGGRVVVVTREAGLATAALVTRTLTLADYY
ncbi:MAG TPA: aspartyl protease family protein [Caulobacteraceae bacterium]|nr:aspartyl protease family protein [Caulobacteraceae bacterium]